MEIASSLGRISFNLAYSFPDAPNLCTNLLLEGVRATAGSHHVMLC
jgi:hypothetical protein